MSRNRVPSPLDAVSAERLLAGEPVIGHDRLADLLAAAAAPAHAHELADDSAVLLAFRDAHLTPTPSSHACAPPRSEAARAFGLGPVLARVFPRRSPLTRTHPRKSTLARAFTLKIAVLIAAASGIGGVALAASTGYLPEPGGRNVPGEIATDDPGTSAQFESQPGASSDRPISPERLIGLCDRYAAHDRDHRQKALNGDSEFRDLVARAGSRDRSTVDRYCDQLRHSYPSGAPGANDRPSGSWWPYPSGAPGPSGSPGANPGFPWPGPSRTAPTPTGPHSWWPPNHDSSRTPTPTQPGQPTQPTTRPRVPPNS